MKRRKTRLIKIGNIGIGYKFPVAIQAMTKNKTDRCDLIINEIKRLQENGAEIVRLAIKDAGDAKAIKIVKTSLRLPLVGDIHFDYRLALLAINNGIDKIRLNPGNIYKPEQVREVVLEAKKAHIPIRVGLNSGSMPTTDMIKSAVGYIRFIEKLGFYDIVISLKASDVNSTIDCYRKIALLCDYPLHLGITATGVGEEARIKSAIGIGVLLSEGIGDTLRVSLTGPSVEEVIIAKQILKTLNLRKFGGIDLVSCPTCGRCEVDLVGIVKQLEEKLSLVKRQRLDRPIKVAVMGCVVNGPGEAKEADFGLAFGQKSAILFKKGELVKKTSDKEAVNVLIRQIEGLDYGRIKK